MERSVVAYTVGCGCAANNTPLDHIVIKEGKENVHSCAKPVIGSM